MSKDHEDEIRDSAQKILAIARQNLVEALRGREDLKQLQLDQDTRIETLKSVIAELAQYEK